MADREKLRQNVSQPFVKRGIFYAVSLGAVAIFGTLGFITAEQAESIEQALPQIIVMIFGAGSSVTALANVHRGSDSRVNDDDYDRVKNAVPDTLPTRSETSMDEVLQAIKEIRGNDAPYTEVQSGPRHAAPDDATGGYPG